MKKVLIKVNGLVFTPKNKYIFQDFNWNKFEQFEDVFCDTLGWTEEYNCGTFVEEKTDRVIIEFHAPDYQSINDFLSWTTCVAVNNVEKATEIY